MLLFITLRPRRQDSSRRGIRIGQGGVRNNGDEDFSTDKSKTIPPELTGNQQRPASLPPLESWEPDMSKMIASVLAMIAASYATYYWHDYSNYNSCFLTLGKLKSAYEQSRPRGGHYQIEDGFARATELCGEKKYDAAKSALGKAIVTCQVNRGCVTKRS
jgi:hypothetical protein